MTTTHKSRWFGIFPKPTTKQGKWALLFALGNIVLMFLWTILPGGGAAGLISGMLAGIFAIIAIARFHERSWLVYLAILPLLGVFVFFAGELLIPH